MAGLVIDIWIAFLVRTALNAWRKITTTYWPVYPGKITGFHYEQPGWGCDYGEYRYQYSVDGNLYRGKHRTPYFVHRSPDAQQSSSIGAVTHVRISPRDPAKSVLIDF